MSDAATPVRALLIAHVPTRTIASFLRRMADDGFVLDASEDPGRVHWPSSAWQHSHLICWMRGPRAGIARWDREPGVLGFTEDDGLSWDEIASRP